MKQSCIFFLLLVSLAFLSVSCTKEFDFGRGGSRRIQARVTSQASHTKAGASDQDGRFVGSYTLDNICDIPLCIAVYEYDNDFIPEELAGEDGNRTKGAVLNTDLINRNGQQFSMNAWLESTNRYDPVGFPGQAVDGHVYETDDANDYHFMKSATATRSGSAWDLSCIAPENTNWNMWRNKVPTNFWAMFPSVLGSSQGTISIRWPGIKADDDDQKEISFDYALPSPSSDFNDAENQPDLCFAYSRKTWDETAAGNDSNVDINFKHAMSVVHFNISEVLGTIAVKKIGINNVPSAAHCEIKGTPAAANGKPGDLAFSWSGHSSPKNYMQAYGNADFDSSKTLNPDKSSKLFMMIPGTLNSNTEICAEFEVKGVTVSRSVNISKTDSGEPVAWQPGKRYLYRILFKGLENYTFYLDESGHPKSADRLFRNTTNSESVTIPVVSAAVDAENVAVNDVDWTIKSVQVGSGSPQTIGAGSFSNIGGLSASRNGGILTITANARTNVYPGSHDYWLNQSPQRTDNLNWSPSDWSGKGVIDLSRFDFQTENTNAPMTTANCYIVRHAGTYKLPLVYGNGIVNGAFNTQAYNPATMATGGDSNYFLKTFRNHLDNEIHSPFIEYNTHNGNPGAHDYITPHGYEIVWQDEADIITINGLSKESVTVRDASGNNTSFNVSYLTFTIPQDRICQNNALIAVRDAHNNILWSWHIWITNDPALLQSSPQVRNQTGVTYSFFPLYNLGWIDNNSYPKRDDIRIILEQKSSGNTITIMVEQPEVKGVSNGCYYTFGRKDPMLRNSDDTPRGSGSFTIVNSRAASLGAAIQHPETFFSGDTDWLGIDYHNLWTGMYCSIGYVDDNPLSGLIKTIYDPSPRGYKVPSTNAYTGFSYSNTEWTSATGFSFKTGTGSEPFAIFFAAAGYRDFTTGKTGNIGKQGFYWSSSPSAIDKGYQLGFNEVPPTVISRYSHARNYGYPVRPVEE